MCNDFSDYKPYEPSPEWQLMNLIKDNLDVQVNHEHLKLFMQLHWEKIKKLAHKIHEDSPTNNKGE